MLTIQTSELKKTRQIPEAYVSGFSFLEPDAQKEFSEMEYNEIKYLFMTFPKDIARYVHELWRTGRLEEVYNYFVDPTREMRESVIITIPGEEYHPDEVVFDDIAFNIAIMLKKGVPRAECNAFIHDLVCASANVRDHQESGKLPLKNGYVENREIILLDMVSKCLEGIKDIE